MRVVAEIADEEKACLGVVGEEVRWGLVDVKNAVVDGVSFNDCHNVRGQSA